MDTPAVASSRRSKNTMVGVRKSRNSSLPLPLIRPTTYIIYIYIYIPLRESVEYIRLTVIANACKGGYAIQSRVPGYQA